MATYNFINYLRTVVERTPGPRYLAVASAIADAVAEGVLRSGDQLPPQRQLAASLAMDLTTVSRAYAEARHQGLLAATVGRGTFVQAPERLPAMRADPVTGIDMMMNCPPQVQQPAPLDLLREGWDWMLTNGDMRSVRTYHAGAGSIRSRDAAVEWLRPTMGAIHPDRVVVCAGAQCALTALLTTLARPGDTVLTEALTYPVFRALAAQLGIRLVSVVSDSEGLMPDALANACEVLRPKAIYCIPTIQNPTTVTIPIDRRRALAKVVLRQKLIMIEDDPYGMLPSQPLPSISSFAAKNAYYICTVSKSLSPGLRTAFVVTPDLLKATRLAEATRAVSLMASPFLTGLVVHWIEQGTAHILRDGIRQEAAARQVMAHDQLAGYTMAAHPEGLHIWLTLPSHLNRLDFTAHIRRQGLALVPSDAFLVAAGAPNAFRICVGAADSRADLYDAFQLIADALKDGDPAMQET